MLFFNLSTLLNLKLMTDNIIEEIKGLIEKLSESNFNQLVKNYLKEYYESKEVNISNGPYDGGIDAVVYRNGREIKKSIQITVQKTNIKEKLFQDIKKSSENKEKYGYLGVLEFYINQKMSQEKK